MTVDQGRLFKDKKKPTALESVVSRACKQYLKGRNIYHLRLNSGKIFYQGRWIHLCPEGTPDLFCLYRGKAVFIETKRKGEKPTDEQLATHAYIIKSGGWVIVAYELDDLVRELKVIDGLVSKSWTCNIVS
jgi:hypothetical protein